MLTVYHSNIEEVGYYVGLSLAPGIGPGYARVLCAHFNSLKAIYEASQKELAPILRSEKTAHSFVNFRRSYNPKKTLKDFSARNITALISSDPRYPKRLIEMSDPPICLYVRGDLESYDLNEHKQIAIVGTRRMSAYGKSATRMIAHDMSRAGFTIVSGMALGVDASAHMAALELKNPTIAFLGCGVDIVYPSANRPIYERIVDGGGLVVSEFPPGQTPMAGLFVSRNRLVSKISLGVVVVEGAMGSGAMVTARLSANQGVDVFAVPGAITSTLSAGPLSLIHDGAMMARNAQDILEHYGMSMGDMLAHKSIMQSDLWPRLDQIEKEIVQHLLEAALDLDTLVEKTQHPPHKIMRALSMLEIHGLIEKSQEGVYVLNSV